MEEGTGDIVEVASACIDLPGFSFAHAPQLNLAIITGRDNKGEGRVECRPIDASVVTLKNVLDDSVGVAKEVSLGVGPLHLILFRVSDRLYGLYEGQICCTSKPIGWAVVDFFLRPEMSQTRTVWSMEADTT